MVKNGELIPSSSRILTLFSATSKSAYWKKGHPPPARRDNLLPAGRPPRAATRSSSAPLGTRRKRRYLAVPPFWTTKKGRKKRGKPLFNQCCSSLYQSSENFWTFRLGTILVENFLTVFPWQILEGHGRGNWFQHRTFGLWGCHERWSKLFTQQFGPNLGWCQDIYDLR